jgi:hypothetical protein
MKLVCICFKRLILSFFVLSLGYIPSIALAHIPMPLPQPTYDELLTEYKDGLLTGYEDPEKLRDRFWRYAIKTPEYKDRREKDAACLREAGEDGTCFVVSNRTKTEIFVNVRSVPKSGGFNATEVEKGTVKQALPAEDPIRSISYPVPAYNDPNSSPSNNWEIEVSGQHKRTIFCPIKSNDVGKIVEVVILPGGNPRVDITGRSCTKYDEINQ